MDQFQDGEHVRLRSRVHGTYLHADEDGHGVSLPRRGASMNAVWSVHIYHRDGPQLLLYSAAYGRYLAATDARATPGHRGFRAVQCDYDRRHMEAIKWHAVWAESENYVVLRDVAGRCLRANKRYLSRNNGVSVDDIDYINNVSTMMHLHWFVELIPARDGLPPLPRPIWHPFPGTGIVTALLPSRMILYVREGADGSRITRGSFKFRGRSVFRLRKKLVRRLRAIMDVSKLVVCVEAGAFGRLTPLVVDLPRSRHNLHIVVIEAGTPAHAELRCPDVDAV
ncbi:hypothetical protein CFC21_107510 [Triticum aestivum]|uniref:Uncharacterized protein n=2 Tax=Triticum aestivum TaxID=4565 RepID=A0A3B6TJU3_WHEAT|nr:uncharacterized protein LOC123168987 [Triticum aestivum]KAF7106799.1 hypothetical protein CFC21_107510 [Triticum aestivum]